MPWSLKPPRPPWTPYWYVRGTYLGIALYCSTGTSNRRAAARILATWKEQAERGEFDKPAAHTPPGFASASLAYLRAGGARAFLAPILKAWGDRPLDEIDQVAIDDLATQLYPSATAATRNRQVYTPVSAVLKHVGVDAKIKRPKGWRGSKRTFWLSPEQTFRVLDEASKIAPEFGALCTLLNYTGLRLSEALGLLCENIDLSRSYAYVPTTKTDEPRAVHLPPIVIEALARLPRGLERKGRVFRYHNGGRLRDMLTMATEAAGVDLPHRTAFHVFRHTYATWMRLYGGLDGLGLVRTGAWADLESVARYSHSETSAEARRADVLPTPTRARRVQNDKQKSVSN
jgi:integrase